MLTAYSHHLMRRNCSWAATALVLLAIMGSPFVAEAGSNPSPELARHLTTIAELAQPSPMITIPAGLFLLGSKQVNDDPSGRRKPFDDTELPQRRVWLDSYEMDRDEVSLGEYLAFLQQQKLHPSDDLQKLIFHVITVHSIPDQTLTRWPALYVTWQEAKDLCLAKQTRLPTEAEWEKAARGPDGRVYPWGNDPPTPAHAVFNLKEGSDTVSAIGNRDKGKSPYGVHDLAGNLYECRMQGAEFRIQAASEVRKNCVLRRA